MFKITYTIDCNYLDRDNYDATKTGRITEVFGETLDEAKSNLVNQLQSNRFGHNADKTDFDHIVEGKLDESDYWPEKYVLNIISVDEVIKSHLELGEITEIEEAVKAKKEEIEAEKKKKREQAKRKKLTKEQKELKELQRLLNKYSYKNVTM